MKKFSKLNKLIQWSISIVFGTALILILSWWIEKVNESIIWIFLIFVLVPLIQFLITPLFTMLKLYTYYSPMIVVFGANSRILNIHNGTSFDYLLEMSGTKPGINWKKKMLVFYINGLLEIAKQIEEGILPDFIIVRGSSYFFSSRTAAKFGFDISESTSIEKLNILLNYLDLLWMYSLTNGKLSFPNLKNIKTVRISGEKLLENKHNLMTLSEQLNVV